MKLVTLKDLKLRAREAADMVHSRFITDDELVRYINTSIEELYDLLVERYGADYYVKDTPYCFKTNSKNDPVDLPHDFYKAAGVDASLGGDNKVSLVPFNFAERNKFSNYFHGSYYDTRHVRYRIMGNQIRFVPKISGNIEIDLWYIPVAPTLENDSDELNGVNGFEEIVVVDSAMKMLMKEESDYSGLLQRKMMMIDRIQRMADNRDQQQSNSVSDVYSDSFFPRNGNF